MLILAGGSCSCNCTIVCSIVDYVNLIADDDARVRVRVVSRSILDAVLIVTQVRCVARLQGLVLDQFIPLACALLTRLGGDC